VDELSAGLATNRAVTEALILRAEQAAANWTTPRAPGKWTPAQVMEHVARALGESANVINGVPDKYPTLPGFLRPLMRRLFFDRTVRKGTFPRAKTSRALDPEEGPESPAAARARVSRALDRFEEACRARATAGAIVESKVWGRVELGEYIKFTELHTRHHTEQIPTD